MPGVKSIHTLYFHYIQYRFTARSWKGMSVHASLLTHHHETERRITVVAHSPAIFGLFISSVFK